MDKMTKDEQGKVEVIVKAYLDRFVADADRGVVSWLLNMSASKSTFPEFLSYMETTIRKMA